MKEIRKLAKNAPDGVTFVPGDEDCLNEIYAEIDGPGVSLSNRSHLHRICLQWHCDTAVSIADVALRNGNVLELSFVFSFHF